MELKSGAETHVLPLFVGFLAAWAVNQASIQSGLHVKCTCSRLIRKFVYVIAKVEWDVFIGCSWYCEPGWSMGSCHDVVQTESSFGVIFVAFDLSIFFKWLFGGDYGDGTTVYRFDAPLFCGRCYECGSLLSRTIVGWNYMNDDHAYAAMTFWRGKRVVVCGLTMFYCFW